MRCDLQPYPAGCVMDVTNKAVRSPCMMVLKISGPHRLTFELSRIRLKIEMITITMIISGLTISSRSKRAKKNKMIPGNSGVAVAGIWLPIKKVIPTTSETNRQNPL